MLGRPSTTVRVHALTIVRSFFKFFTVFDHTGAEVYGVASIFPSLSHLAVSDPGAIKVRGLFL